MNNTLKKWLPAIITLGVILLFIIISLFSKTTVPTFNLDEEESIDVSEVINMLNDENTKKQAESKLDELYKDHTKDDTYYLTKALIIMETDNDINALDTLNNVKNKTEYYYGLRVRSAAGRFFTMGEVPSDLLNTALEAANKYSDNLDFQLLVGQLYYDKDNYTAAAYYLDKALQIDENDVESNYYYALSVYLLDSTEDGIKYMEKAKSLYKGDDNAFKEAMDNYLSIMKEGKR